MSIAVDSKCAASVCVCIRRTLSTLLTFGCYRVSGSVSTARFISGTTVDTVCRYAEYPNRHILAARRFDETDTLSQIRLDAQTGM